MIVLNLNPQDLFTTGSITTLAGSAGLVFIACNAIQHVFNYNPKWLALAFSMIVAFIGAYIGIITLQMMDLQKLSDAQRQIIENPSVTYLIAIFNGFLIYLTATGANQIASNTPPRSQPSAHPGANKLQKMTSRKFNSNWWRS